MLLCILLLDKIKLSINYFIGSFFLFGVVQQKRSLRGLCTLWETVFCYLYEGNFNVEFRGQLDSYVVHLIVDKEEYVFSILTSDEMIDKEYVLNLIDTVIFE